MAIESQKVSMLKTTGETKSIEKKKVLFLCTHNSARSQMAEGLLNHTYPERYDAFSAGATPSTVNPLAVKVMAEIGVDISRNRSKSINEFHGQHFDTVVTVCTSTNSVQCPFCSTRPLSKENREAPLIIRRNVSYGKWFEHGYPDPGEVEGGESRTLAAFRRTRDEMAKWIKEYFNQ